MRANLLWAAIFLLSMASNAAAGSVVLGWDASATATSYIIQQSVDNGATWTTIATPGLSACAGTPAKCSVTVTLPSSGMVLVRFGAVNSIGQAVRYGDGIWHNESWNPPAPAANVGVQ